MCSRDLCTTASSLCSSLSPFDERETKNNRLEMGLLTQWAQDGRRVLGSCALETDPDAV